MGHLESYLLKVKERSDSGNNVLDSPRLQKVTAGSWNWSWALDEDEHPPPSSIVSRRDTWEARQLARIADIMPEHTISGNKLWQHLVTFLTVTPDKKVKLPAEREHPKPEVAPQAESDWTNVSLPSDPNSPVQTTTIQAVSLTQTNGTAFIPEPLDLGPSNRLSPRWSYWTRGSLWRERFRVARFSKTHKRGQSSASATASVAHMSTITTLNL